MIFFDTTSASSWRHSSGLARVSRRLLEELGGSAKGAQWPGIGAMPGRADSFLTPELFSEPERPGFTAFIERRPCRLAALFHDAIPRQASLDHVAPERGAPPFLHEASLPVRPGVGGFGRKPGRAPRLLEMAGRFQSPAGGRASPRRRLAGDCPRASGRRFPAEDPADCRNRDPRAAEKTRRFSSMRAKPCAAKGSSSSSTWSAALTLFSGGPSKGASPCSVQSGPGSGTIRR